MAEIEGRRKKRGAPIGNQNARKHGYYSRVLTPQQQEYVAASGASSGLDEEIAILRSKITSVLVNAPQNHRLLFEGLSLLVRMLGIQKAVRDLQVSEAAAIQESVDHFLGRLFPEDNSASE